MTMLSDADHQFFEGKGYLAVPGVVPEDNLQAAIMAICMFLGIERDNPDTWDHLDLGENGIVPFHHHQAFWNNRQHPTVHQVFSELIKTPKLWVTMDRASFKPPFPPQYPERWDDSDFHWDLDPQEPRGLALQGVLYLTDTSGDQGAFQCLPQIYCSLNSWLAQHQELQFAESEVGTHQVVRVPGRAGTLVIWDSRLPHRSGSNRTNVPRFAQYITMYPAGNQQERWERVQRWRERRAPAYWRGWQYQLDREPGEPAGLSPLGRKLLGLDEW
jgi:hypothetical protein